MATSLVQNSANAFFVRSREFWYRAIGNVFRNDERFPGIWAKNHRVSKLACLCQLYMLFSLSEKLHKFRIAK